MKRIKILLIIILTTLIFGGFPSNNPMGRSGLQMPPRTSQECVNAVKEYRKEQNSPYLTQYLSKTEIEEFIDKRGNLKYKVLSDVFDKCKLKSSSEFKRVLTIPTSVEEQQCLYYIKTARQYHNMAYKFHNAKNYTEQNKFLKFSIRDIRKAENLCNKKGASKDAMKTIEFYLEEIPKHLNETKKQ
jgi:hypothetical protein